MFDDQVNNQAVPGNLPVGEPASPGLQRGEPEDIFSGVEKTAPQNGGVENRPPSALDRGVLRPKQEVPPMAPMEQPPQMTTPPTDIYQVKEPTLTRGIITFLVIVVILGVLGGGGWWIYNSFIKTGGQDQVLVPEVQAPLVDIETPPAEEPVVVPAEPAVEEPVVTDTNSTDVAQDVADDQILFGEPIDKDGDGLDDTKEAELATDPNNWDTDGDLLGDGDEVLVWKTDPLKPDTDGDGYKDGAEVKSGYNPNGSGKIFTVPTSTVK